jgi:hypothetical protein
MPGRQYRGIYAVPFRSGDIMRNNLEDLIEKIKKLQKELDQELQKKEEEFFYKIRGKRVYFEKEIRRRHKILVKNMFRYLSDAALLNILTAPIIWFCFLPAVFMDIVVSLYQTTCFRVYKIPRVRRGQYIVIDRHALRYLNPIEKLNCVYCGYFTGLIAFVQEVAARTEQYWCPIKHARRVANIHNRYGRFVEYGDAQGYKNNLEKIRRDFDDLQ